MKVSQDKKKEIKTKLIKTAVELFIEKGFDSTTMREISEKSGMGNATIYNYFPGKNKILYAYFEEKHLDLIELLKKIPEFENYSLKEKLQVQMESLLDIFLEDREFVQEAYRLIFDSPLKTFSEFAPIKQLFIKNVKEYLSCAVKNNEIPEQHLQNFLVNIYWEYSTVIVLYWLRDDSSGFTNTSRVIDMSLGIFSDILKTDIIGKTTEIFSFLFRSHLYGNIEKIHQFLSTPMEMHRKFKKFTEEGTKKDER